MTHEEKWLVTCGNTQRTVLVDVADGVRGAIVSAVTDMTHTKIALSEYSIQSDGIVAFTTHVYEDRGAVTTLRGKAQRVFSRKAPSDRGQHGIPRSA